MLILQRTPSGTSAGRRLRLQVEAKPQVRLIRIERRLNLSIGDPNCNPAGDASPGYLPPLKDKVAQRQPQICSTGWVVKNNFIMVYSDHDAEMSARRIYLPLLADNQGYAFLLGKKLYLLHKSLRLRVNSPQPDWNARFWAYSTILSPRTSLSDLSGVSVSRFAYTFC
jgi:hypothetical protein